MLNVWCWTFEEEVVSHHLHCLALLHWLCLSPSQNPFKRFAKDRQECKSKVNNDEAETAKRAGNLSLWEQRLSRDTRLQINDFFGWLQVILSSHCIPCQSSSCWCFFHSWINIRRSSTFFVFYSGCWTNIVKFAKSGVLLLVYQLKGPSLTFTSSLLSSTLHHPIIPWTLSQSFTWYWRWDTNWNNNWRLLLVVSVIKAWEGVVREPWKRASHK